MKSSSEPIGDTLLEAARAELLDAAAWGDVLSKYARTMRLAVALTDVDGRVLGTCHNPQPIWSLVHAQKPPRLGECPFHLMPSEACTCVADALKTKGFVIKRSQWGLAHVTVPLFLGSHAVGALIAGQVFDEYPQQLPVERLARQAGLSPQQVWQIARKQHPIGRKTLLLYGDLLSTLGQTFLQARYGVISERSRQAEIARGFEIERQAKELAEANRNKNEFIAMLAHELRNPLSAIANALQLIQKPGTEEQAEWSIGVIDRQVKQLTHLIDDLLDVARIAQGKIQLRKEIVDPSTIIHQAVESVRPLAARKRHQISLSITTGRMAIEGDPTRLEQILVNLLTNAAKYSENGGCIWLSAKPEGGELVIKVKDTGIGIPPEKLPEMFELFAQGDRSLVHSDGGLGIGLTLVRKLTELHGGSVTATSEGPGKGSEFTLRLPESAQLPIKIREAQEHGQPIVGPKSRVLIVDDDRDTASTMAKLLNALGHEAYIAYDGPSAIAAAEGFQPRFVLLDIGLPGMDGYQVARRLRHHECCKNSVIIAVSGYGQDEDFRRSKEAGFDHHLVKPIDHKALITLLTASHSGP